MIDTLEVNWLPRLTRLRDLAAASPTGTIQASIEELNLLAREILEHEADPAATSGIGESGVWKKWRCSFCGWHWTAQRADRCPYCKSPDIMTVPAVALATEE